MRKLECVDREKFCDEPQMVMEDYIRTADKMMYRIKQERKRERR